MTMRRLGSFTGSVLLAVTALAAPATKLSLQCDAYNNTAAVNGGFDLANGNAATWNISTVPFRQLLYSGAKTKVYAHVVPWFCVPGLLERDQVQRCNGHVISGYNSNDTLTVARQIEDMIARGADGVIVDYYRTALEDETTLKIRDQAEQHENFELAVMEDKENYRYAVTPEARAEKFLADVAYINSTYFGSPAYMRRDGRPVLFVFQDDSVVDWIAVRAGVRALGDPLLIFGNDFDHPAADGAFAWIDIADPIGALADFYKRARAHPGSLVWGAVFAGFDDRLAAWGSRRMVDRKRGQTWLETFATARRHFGPENELPNVQIVTFNDYDEGTETESGIDNGLSLTATIRESTLSWTVSGPLQTVSAFRIFTSPNSRGETLILRDELPAGGAHSFDLSTLPGGNWNIFIQAQGQPGIRNHTVDAGRYGRAKPARRRAVTPAGPISVLSPANCATLRSPLRVTVVENDEAPTTLQVYLDGQLVIERSNVVRLDETIAVAPGAHQIAAKGWYAGGPSEPVWVNVAVETPPVTISLPHPGSTLSSPIRVIAEENTDAPATAMQIYLDGVLVLERFNVEKLDERIAACPGVHQITAKAWFANASSELATVEVTATRAPVTISSPADGASVDSPFRVVADAPDAGAMQIYLDGVLYTDRQGVQHLDEQVAAAPGSHEAAVKAWYCDGSNALAIIRVTVR